MLNQNNRFVIFTVAVIALLIISSILPASAQLSQWRSLNPTRDGAFLSRTAPAPFLYGVQMLTPNYGWAVGGTCEIYTDDPYYSTTTPNYGCASSHPSIPIDGNGFALFWDGVRWRETLVPASAYTLTAVFIVSANDVWAVGMSSTIIHWDGISWVAVAIPSGIDLYSVFILPGGMDGWAVGDSSGTAKILRWSGTWPTGAWSVFTLSSLTASLRGVFLSSSTQGWAVGTSGTILRWDGAGWMATISPTVQNLYSVFAVSASDAWAVGARGAGGAGTIIRWNGASWTGPMVAPTTNVDYRSIRMVSSNDGWIAGSVDPTSKEGTVLRWNGAAWAIVRSWVTVNLNGLFMLPGAGGTGSVVGDAETIARWNGSIWFAQTSPTSTNLNAVSMVSANDGWAVGNNGTIFRYDGASWSHYETLPSQVNLYGLHMRTSTDGWAVGAPPFVPSPPDGGFPPTILRWEGTAWTAITPSGVALGQTLYAVDTVSATESWAVGDGTGTAAAAMLKWDGTIWTSVPSATPVDTRLYGIDMLSSNDGWAVGCTTRSACNTPVIVRWNGLAWSQVTAPAVAGLYSVFMLSPTDGWAVGNATSGPQATIIHWDGVQWRQVPGPAVATDGFLRSVHMVSSTDGWAVGYYGTASFPDGSNTRSLIVHWDGLTWNVVATLPLPPTMAVPLRSVFMVATLDGWIVSGQGLILHYGPESVPGTTTSMTTSTSFTTVVSTVTSTTSASSTSTLTPASGGTWGVPGFPIESILAGLLGGLIALTVIRRRRRLQLEK